MKSPLVIFLLLLGTVGLTAQSATIVDADGWTNVREKPSKDSEVVTRVNQGEFFFWVDPDYNNDYGDWIEVRYNNVYNSYPGASSFWLS